MAKQKAEKKFMYTLLSEQQMLDREQQYTQRLRDYEASNGLIQKSLDQYVQWQAEEVKHTEWRQYLLCDGLPRPTVPSEMRSFIAKIQHFHAIDVKQNVDWPLSVDERSILNQSIFRTDKTRNTIRDQNPDIGEFFAKDVKSCLMVLSLIDHLLENETELGLYDLQRQMEIIVMRTTVEQQISTLFDQLTYRVIRADAVYMKSYDAKVGRYSYKTDDFALDIWCLRNVPIRFQNMDVPLMIADLDCIGVIVQLPLSVLQDNLTMQCVHTKFDRITANAKSFELQPIQTIDPISGIVDIQDCLIYEWFMQLDIQNEILQMLYLEYRQYEVAMKEMAAIEVAQAKEDKNKNNKKIKMPKEPQNVPDNMYPDTYMIFIEREQKQYMEFLDYNFHPRHLELDHDELNLRKYIMIGGIYSLQFIRRPSHTAFEKFDVTLHEDGRVLYTIPDVVADLKAKLVAEQSDYSILTEKRSTKRFDRARQTEDQDSKRETAKPLKTELRYFYVTIKLPPHLFLWGEFQAAHFVSELIEEQIGDDIYDMPIKTKSLKGKRVKSKLRDSENTSDINLLRPKNTMFSAIARKSEAKPANIFRPTLLSLVRKSLLVEQYVEPTKLYDYIITGKLDHYGIRNLERYCLPRVLSSFVLPMEIKQQIEREGELGAKKTNLLLRRKEEESEIIVPNLYFDYNDQHGPERIFPIFENVPHIYYPDDPEPADKDGKQTMYGLLNTLNDIKDKYLSNYENIMYQEPFEVVKQRKKTQNILATTSQLALLPTPSTLAMPATPTTTTTAKGSLSEIPRESEPSESMSTKSKSSIPTVIHKIEVKYTKITHWVTKHIYEMTVNKDQHTVTIKTDRLGIIGFAFKRYEHFPFRDWSLHPSENDPEEIQLNVDTFHVRIILYISARGVRGYATKITTEYVTHPIKYMNIVEPISDFLELRKVFCEHNINIFAQSDASYYIENGYFSIKHLSSELHCYSIMALHCKLMKFSRSSWNRLATRRNLILCMKTARDVTGDPVTVRVMPEQTEFVDITELCSDNLDEFNLLYKPTWRNVAQYADLHQAIVSMQPNATEIRNKNPLLVNYVKKILSEISLLSYS